MKFQEIFDSPLLRLPKSFAPGKSFRASIDVMFDAYIALFEQVTEGSVKFEGIKENRSVQSIITVQKKFIEGLRQTLEYYFDGQPAKAYDHFQVTMNSRVRSFKTLETIREFGKRESFYRIRIKEDNFALKAREMFHIPFEFRGRVSTQRYSIPGFPSLYLGKSLYVTWEELKRPNLDRFQAVRLESTDNIKCLDLTKPNWGNNPMKLSAYRYLMIWPLIAACSIKVTQPADSFKPEYVLPQLLLQWVRNRGDIDGILYASTNISLKPKKPLKNLFNVVLPVKDNKDQGLCNVLCSKFRMTASVSRQLLNASSTAHTRPRTEAELSRIDEKIPPLEIIRGHESHYRNSELGKLEMILDEMTTTAITPE